MFDAVKHPQKRAFLEAYSLTGSVKFASHAAKVKRANHYDWKANDAAYAEAFALAETMAADALVDEAKRRAQFGVKDFVLYKGQVVMYEGKPLMRRKFADGLLQFLLEGLKPDTFHERREIAHSAPDGLKVDVEVKHALDLSGLSEDELTALERIAGKVTSKSSGPA